MKGYLVEYKIIPEIPENVKVLAVLLMFAQILDCFFTSLGISIWGTQSEGNFILRNMMALYDPQITLVFTKSLTILLIVFVASKANEIKIIKNFLGLSLCIYFFTALLPWSSIIGKYLAFQINFPL